jgi:DNA polymerase-1
MHERKRFLLIDGNALIHRSYHGLPPLSTKDGELVNAVYGFASTVLAVLEKFRPEYIAATFDLPGKTFRHERFAEYKGTRAKAPDDLYAQIPRVKELTRALNIPIYELAGFEADDCVGTLARQATELDADTEVIIVTGDSDAFQLVNDRVSVCIMRKGVKDTVLFDEEAVVAKYGLKPSQLRDYKGLRGDASDNIPGVKGIGEKGATELLQRYGSLEGVYTALDEIRGALREKLSRDRARAFLSKELGTIDVRVPIELDRAACRARDFDRRTVTELFRALNFTSLIKRLPKDEATLARDTSFASASEVLRLETSEVIRSFCARGKMSGKPATFALDEEIGALFGASLAGMVLVWNGTIAWAKYAPENDMAWRTFLEDAAIAKTTYDAKYVLKRLHERGMRPVGIDFDVMLAGYALDAGSKVDLETLVLTELGVTDALDTGGAKVSAIARLRPIFEEKLAKMSEEQAASGGTGTAERVFRTVEIPLTEVLAAMEERGIRLNGEALRNFSRELGEDLAVLERQIHDFAGQTFNINSPKQLAKVLFEDLHIPTVGIKKLKTGFSTASPELAKLRDTYAIVQKVERYREWFKLKTTYLDTLPSMVDAASRLHTQYQQAATTTGRLSSIHPNLQNIPARGDWGERVRSAFEACEGFVLVGADYSQIELRVAAHLSDDAVMIEAFRKGEDIHRTTAALVYQVDPSDVTDDMRRRAKVMNFGVMYGMGSFGLAQAAGVSREEAARFIAGYFEKFSGMAAYLERVKTMAQSCGYVETALGRRRYIAEINSPNQTLAKAAERMAVNMPIQGLEADIVKLAMLAASDLLRERYDGAAFLLLQVHDELIFEVREDKAADFVRDIKHSMESVYALRVPLLVAVRTGRNWGEI